MKAKKKFELRVLSNNANEITENQIQWTKNSEVFLKKQLKNPYNRRKHNKPRRWNFPEGKKLNTKLNCRTVVTTFLKNSSVYALNRIGNSRGRTQKVFWGIILIIGVVGCLSQVGEFLASYYDYPVVINLETLSTEFHVFPAVTVCNINSIRRTFELCFRKKLGYEECFGINRTIETKNVNKKLPKCDVDIRKFPNQTELSSNWLLLLASLSHDSRVKYGHQIEDFIQFCAFERRLCSYDDFEPSLSHMYGNCYTFNSGTVKRVSRNPGPVTGLLLDLNLETDKYATFTRSVGARVQVHDPHFEHNADYKGIYVNPGYETHVAITKSVISRLQAPYKDRCKMYEEGHSATSCKEMCNHNVTTKLCHCSMLKDPRSFPKCDLTDPLTICCLGMSDRNSGTGICDCPLSCEEIQYNIKVSSSVWPSREHYEANKDIFLNSTYDRVRETRLRLKIYYDTLEYTVYRQAPMYQSSELLSLIGGQMGLWVGLSLVAIFECVESFIIFCQGKRYL